MTTPDPMTKELLKFVNGWLVEVAFGTYDREDLPGLADKMLAEFAKTLEQRVERADLEARIDERRELRKLFDALNMQFGASAGSATGIMVKNDFGEEFIFQLDRYALNALLSRFNSKAALSSGFVEGGEK